MRVLTEARAPVAMLTTPCPKHSGTEVLPGRCAVQGVVATTVRLTRMDGAAAAGAARYDTADGAQLHGSARSEANSVAARLPLETLECTPFDIETSVGRVNAAVYSPAVLRLQHQVARDRLTVLDSG